MNAYLHFKSVLNLSTANCTLSGSSFNSISDFCLKNSLGSLKSNSNSSVEFSNEETDPQNIERENKKVTINLKAFGSPFGIISEVKWRITEYL